MTADRPASAVQPIATNRRAGHDYELLERLEAGLVLRGTEVKSLREGAVSLAGGFARSRDGEFYLVNVHIKPFAHGNVHNHEPLRPRKLLLRRREANRLIGKVETRGLTLVPLRLYFKRGWAKVELAVARGRSHRDKRQQEREKTARREIERGLRERQKD